MTSINQKPTLFKIFSLLALASALVSCQKDDKTSYYSSQSNVDIGEVISQGVCEIFNVKSESARMCYMKEEDLYYLDYFYDGDGSFGFKWDKTTNVISIVQCDTGLCYNYFYPIDFLSQATYEVEMGVNALPSYYSPDEDKFYFNVLYQTAESDNQIFRNTASITYKPNAHEDK